MSDDVKWNDDKPKFENMGVDGIGELKLINGIWVAENGDQYAFETVDGELTLTKITF